MGNPEECEILHDIKNEDLGALRPCPLPASLVPGGWNAHSFPLMTGLAPALRFQGQSIAWAVHCLDRGQSSWNSHKSVQCWSRYWFLPQGPRSSPTITWAPIDALPQALPG